MRRREIMALVGAAVATWPLVARAQQPANPVIGLLDARSRAAASAELAAFLQSLAGAGYSEGRNLAIEYRWADGQYNRLPALAADLVNFKPALIATPGATAATLAAKAATKTIPIVFVTASDPIGLGLVQSLNRPGGNLTGVTFLADQVTGKRLELLHEIVPAAKLVAVLVNPANAANAASQLKKLQEAAPVLGVHLLVLHAENDKEIDAAFATIAQQHADALLLSSDPFLASHRDRIIALTTKFALPSIEGDRDFAVMGGLAAYGSSVVDAWRLAGGYAARILSGATPADLPVQQSTKVGLFLNLKVAKTLGLAIPLSLQGRADEAIE
jgi:putative tryptophan/tyrosine transport system substrate-binding protein